MWVIIASSLILLILLNLPKKKVESLASLRSQIETKDHELRLTYVELEETERGLTAKIDFGAMSTDALQRLLKRSIVHAKWALNNNIFSLRDVYVERIRFITEALGTSFETVGRELDAFMEFPEQERIGLVLLEELKKAVREGDGFHIELHSDNLKPLLKKNEALKPEGYDELLKKGWKNAALRSLQEAEKSIEIGYKFWFDLKLYDAKRYAKKAKVNFSQEIATIKRMWEKRETKTT